jgi:hypothetical protein
VRQMVGAQYSRHPRFHFRTNHVNIIRIDFHITAFNINDSPILPSPTNSIRRVY